MLWLIGLDDTDVLGGRGTGRLARGLAAALAERGLRPRGVTRHQLLVHPDIPYTSHNSANCVAAEGEVADPLALFRWVCEFVAADCPEGSDPGACLARRQCVPSAVIAFGQRAQREVLSPGEAEDAAAEGRCLLAGLGGTCAGVIGALAAVGLRAGGNDGRFLDLGDIRNLQGIVSVQRLLDSGIDIVYNNQGAEPRPQERVETLGWVRPRLLGGRSVLLVERSDAHGVEWVVADRRHGGPKRTTDAAADEG